MAKSQDSQIEHQFNGLVQNIIDSVGDPIMVIDASNYKIMLVNRAMCDEVSGIDPIAMSMTCYEFSHQRSTPCEGLDDPCPLKKVIATGTPIRVTHTHRDDDNNETILDIVTTPVFDDNGNVVQVIETFHDITNIMQEKKAAQESEKQFRTLFENAGDVIFIHDLEGHFIEVNQLACDRFGYTKDELLHMTPMELDSPEYATMVPVRIKEICDNGYAVFETVHLRKDGLPIPTEISSRLIEYAGKPAILSISRDICDRKKAEAALQKERDMAQNYLDVAGVMMVVLDCDQKVTLINKKGAEILGYGEDEIIGKNWFDNFISPNIKDMVKGVYVKLMNGDIEPGEYFENTVVAKDNTEKTIAWHNTILRDENGIISGTLSSGEDITKRKEAEEKLKQYAEDLKHSNELKDLFTDILRHDLLNPAGIIKGYTELLLDMEEDEKKDKFLQKIKQNNEKLIDIIETAANLAMFESVEELKFETKDIAVIIKDVADNFRPQIKNKQMEFEFKAKGTYPANVNPVIEEVFANLLSNAIKYSPQKSKIIVDIIDVGENWKVAVTDSGEGISDEDKPVLFDRFKRVGKGCIKGTGLGLAIVKRLIELHGGSVGVEDNPAGDGCVFWITVGKAK